MFPAEIWVEHLVPLSIYTSIGPVVLPSGSVRFSVTERLVAAYGSQYRITWPSASVSKEACPVHALVEAVCVPTITSVLESARSAAACACAAADWAEDAADCADVAVD